MRYLIAILLSCLYTTVNGQSLKAQANSGNVYALVIGISQYESKALPPLQYAGKDASLFAGYLQSGPAHVPAGNIKLLLNEEATIAAVYNAFDWLKESCRAGDLVYVYFSGHGDVETDDKKSKGYLLAWNTPPNNYSNNAISIDSVNAIANTLCLKNKSNVVLVTDACHTGKLAGDFYKGKQLTAAALHQVLNNEVRLAACAADEEAAEGPDWGGGRGVFSYYLLSGLNGMADVKKDGSIQLQELSSYLDSSMQKDKFLLMDHHRQHPVTDGAPGFTLTVLDSVTIQNNRNNLLDNNSSTGSLPAGLMAFKPVASQPLDCFFRAISQQPLEYIVTFEKYLQINPDSLPLKILEGCESYQDYLVTKYDSVVAAGGTPIFFYVGQADSIALLKKQLGSNKAVINRFNQRFVEWVHAKAQEMINAYLAGDLAELEKRQYYYAGNRRYDWFISMLHVAMQLIPPDHQLAGVLTINDFYLSGLVERLKMPVAKDIKPLLKKAFAAQRKALQLDPYAAYINNELGNLFFNQKKYDSADYYFSMAAALAPSWSIPWSNKIRLNLALHQPAKARGAFQKADSLQPGLAYVSTNGGLAMEQEKNWLLAISFFRKAIDQNHVHYLPFERLGNVYLAIGEYEKADSFLYDAMIRRKDFAVNSAYYEDGVELGGVGYNTDDEEKDSCSKNILFDDMNTKPLKKLAKALLEMETAAGQATAMQLLRELQQQAPGIPLIQHYIGKQLCLDGQWTAAENALLEAVAAYRSPDTLWQSLRQWTHNANTVDTSDCLPRLIMYYRYDLLEDHYLLAYLYEKQGQTEKALQQYQFIAAAENQRQLKQAACDGFTKEIEAMGGASALQFMSVRKYEEPISMGGAIKMARLYEKAGNYAAAEQCLLGQVQANRKAAAIRQVYLDTARHGLWEIPGELRVNFYWLSINRDLEAETYNFYTRMLAAFSRDYEWWQKAGLFLHDRLALSYKLVSAAGYAAFYKNIQSSAYPFQGADEPKDTADKVWFLPGKADSIHIVWQQYDPLQQSLDWLQQSVKLSGDFEPGTQLLAAMADLNSWLGNIPAAVTQYRKVVAAAPPGQITDRNKFINYLVAVKEYPEASAQLDTLYQRHQLSAQQALLLAEYKMLLGKYEEAKTLLRQYQPADKVEKNIQMGLYARIYWLSGQPAKALPYLRDSLPAVTIDEKADDSTRSAQFSQLFFRNYSMARLYAMQKNNAKALSLLKQLLDSGFNLQYVLANDFAWTALRPTTAWKSLLKKYKFEEIHDSAPQRVTENPIAFRIPGFKSQYEYSLH